MSEVDFSSEQYIRALEGTALVVEPVIRKAIRSLGIQQSRGLGLPCGIGMHSVWMAEMLPDLQVMGANLSSTHIEFASALAERAGFPDRLTFSNDDMNKLDYEDDNFDFIWCCDGLWPDPPETGCLVEQPYDALESFKRIVKPGGTIALLFWLSHRLLPGYPLVESTLNATSSANVPMTPDSDPDLLPIPCSVVLSRFNLPRSFSS